MRHAQEPKKGPNNPAKKNKPPEKTAANETAVKKIALPSQFQAVRESALNEITRSTPLLIVISLAMWLGWTPEQVQGLVLLLVPIFMINRRPGQA